MQNFLDNIRTGALMTILVLAVGSISIIGTIQFVKGLDGGNVNGSIIACNYGACNKDTFNGGTSGGGGGGQPTTNTGTLIVTKKLGPGCASTPCPPPETFEIKIIGNNPSPSTVHDDGTGTPVTLGPGDFQLSETPPAEFHALFGGVDCDTQGRGTIAAGETKNCFVINDLTG